MKYNVLRVVIDTNVLISYLLSDHNSTVIRLVDNLIQNHKILFSKDTFLEFSYIISKEKFDKYSSIAERQKFLFLIKETVKFVTIIEKIDVCRDKKDNQFLEVAVNGKADFIITEDKDLLVLDGFRKIRILSPKDFSELVAM